MITVDIPGSSLVGSSLLGSLGKLKNWGKLRAEGSSYFYRQLYFSNWVCVHSYTVSAYQQEVVP